MMSCEHPLEASLFAACLSPAVAISHSRPLPREHLALQGLRLRIGSVCPTPRGQQDLSWAPVSRGRSCSLPAGLLTSCHLLRCILTWVLRLLLLAWERFQRRAVTVLAGKTEYILGLGFSFSLTVLNLFLVLGIHNSKNILQ